MKGKGAGPVSWFPETDRRPIPQAYEATRRSIDPAGVSVAR